MDRVIRGSIRRPVKNIIGDDGDVWTVDQKVINFIQIPRWEALGVGNIIEIKFKITEGIMTHNRVLFGGSDSGGTPPFSNHWAAVGRANSQTLRWETNRFGPTAVVNGVTVTNNALQIELHREYHCVFTSGVPTMIEYLGGNFLGAEEFSGLLWDVYLTDPNNGANSRYYPCKVIQTDKPVDTYMTVNEWYGGHSGTIIGNTGNAWTELI